MASHPQAAYLWKAPSDPEDPEIVLIDVDHIGRRSRHL